MIHHTAKKRKCQAQCLGYPVSVGGQGVSMGRKMLPDNIFTTFATEDRGSYRLKKGGYHGIINHRFFDLSLKHAEETIFV